MQSASASTTASASSSGGSTSTAGGGGGENATTSGGGGSAVGIVINEVSGVGDDWIELYNPSKDIVTLDTMRLADDDAGKPKLAEAVSFPKGTALAPGAYLFVLANLGAQTMAGPQTNCAPGPSPCFQAAFGVGKSGDVVYLVDSKDEVLESVAYPATVPSGETWARLPNGVGAFAHAKPTPGAPNAGP